MSSIYKMLETYEKSNKILQTSKEDEITVNLGKHYRHVNELYNELKYSAEKQKLEDATKIMGLKEKMKLLEEETSHNLKQCNELENMVKACKERANETQQASSVHESEVRAMKQAYEERIRELEKEVERLTRETESANDRSFIKRLETLAQERQSPTFGDCETANTSFQDCLPYEKESRVENLIQKIETLLTKPASSALEDQIEKLQSQLAAAKEEGIVDRQNARTANLNVWKLEKQISELENEKRALNRKLEHANSKVEQLRSEMGNFEPKISALREESRSKDKTLAEMKDCMASIRADKNLERDLRINYEQECIKQKGSIMEYLAKIKMLEESVACKNQLINTVQQKNDELIAEQQRLQYKLGKIDDTCAKINTMAASKTCELDTLRKNYEMLKKACTITDSQISELEVRLKREIELRSQYAEKYHELQREMAEKNEKLTEMSLKLTQEKEMRQRAETAVSKMGSEMSGGKEERKKMQEEILTLNAEIDGKTTQIRGLKKQVEQLSDETLKLKELLKAHDKHINFLKEDHTKVLSDLYTAREEIETQRQAHEDIDRQLNNMLKELNFKEGIIEEQKNSQTKMDVKSTTTLAQYKKMIEYLQNKCETLEKKKKGIASKLFG